MAEWYAEKNDQANPLALYVRPDLIRPYLSSSNPATLIKAIS